MNKTLELLKQVQRIAETSFDGHFTILSFTTGWKAAFGTVDVDTGNGRDQIWSLPNFRTLKEALDWMVSTTQRFE